jgi:peptidoglycan/xylan/chitin deacetylase (PgdA/CDA1 family)
MKIIIRNILIILFYLTSIPFWRRLLLKKPLVRVWCLHEVKDNQVKQFENKIKYLLLKYNVITPGKFINQDLSSKRTNILITFDDGYESWFKNVLPILKKFCLKAVFFINNDFEEYAKELLADGHTLGGHSVTHPYLTELSKEQLENEIWQSVKSNFFAYSFGDKKSYNEQVVSEIKKAGYKFSFTILPGFNNKKTNPYLLHRDSLDADISNVIFKLWLKGCYDWLKAGWLN